MRDVAALLLGWLGEFGHGLAFGSRRGLEFSSNAGNRVGDGLIFTVTVVLCTFWIVAVVVEELIGIIEFTDLALGFFFIVGVRFHELIKLAGADPGVLAVTAQVCA